MCFFKGKDGSQKRPRIQNSLLPSAKTLNMLFEKTVNGALQLFGCKVA